MNRVVIFIGMYLLYFSIFSQSEKVFFKIDQDKGLSNNRITSINQDHHQFIWIATMNGLNRYDGLDTRIYNTRNSTITSDFIFDIHIDTKNRMWLATSKGLCLYDASKDNFTSFINTTNNSKNVAINKIHCILEDNSGKLWLGTKDGVYVFDPEFSTFSLRSIDSARNTAKYKSINSLTQNSKGTIFAGSFGGGLLEYHPAQATFKTVSSDQFILDHIFDLQFINDSEVLIGTSGYGAVVYNLDSHKFYDFFKAKTKQNIRANIIRDITIDVQQNIWLGTDGDGLYQIKNTDKSTQIIHYKNIPQRNSSLSGNAVYKIFQDNSKNYWIGTAWNGVNYLSSKKKYDFLFSDIVGIKTSSVLSIFKDKNTLYLGLDGDGLTSYNTKTEKITHYNPNVNDKFKGSTIQCIHQQEQSLWLGTFADGLIHLDLKTKKYKQYKHSISEKNSISYNDIRAIEEDAKGNLWIATDGGGLNYFDVAHNHFTSYKSDVNDPTTISINNLTALQLVGHNLWIGTSHGGLDHFDTLTKETTHYQYDGQHKNSISSNNILSLLQDSKNNLWIGTASEGINRINFKENTIEIFDDFNESDHQKIMGIVEDTNGTIWFSSKKGIFNYSYTTNNFQNFPNLNKKYHRNSIYKDGEGSLYFGATDGIVKLNPNNFTYEPTYPKVIIKDFTLFNKKVPIDGKILQKHIIEEETILLEHDQDVISFEFATLNYPFSNNFEYNIKMENFDREWRNIGTNNKITYTNLSPGDYVLKLKSRSIGTEWPEDFTAITLRINKPIWLQWWAIGIYVLLVGIVFYIFRTYIISWEKMKSNLELERLAYEKDQELANLKLQFFTNISHEIRTPVTLILLSVNNLFKSEHLKTNEQSNTVNTITKNSNKLLSLVNNLLDYRKLENKPASLKISNSNWVEFSHEIFLSFKEIANQKKIDLKFETKATNVMLWFDKNQMEKVVYNLLANALKFTESNKSIHFKIEENENNMIMIVEDEGIGIPNNHLSKIFTRFYQTEIHDFKKKHSGFGLGLSIAKEVIDLHQGSITVESVLNKGTKFIISLKKGKSHFSNQDVSFIENEEDRIENYVLSPIPSENSELKNSEKEVVKNLTILVVDDNKEIRDYIIFFISKLYHTIEAVDGKQGWEITKKQLPDLIISDVMMPVMDGIEMTHKIKSNINTSHIPIILLTARASVIHQLEGYTTGAEDYIIKPFNEKLLISKIDSIMRNRQLLHKRMSNDKSNVPEKLPINERDQKILENLVQLIEGNLALEGLNSKFIASELGISHSVIYKKVKTFTGLSLIEFITEIRLKTAKNLITEGEYSVTEVCYKVGYSNRKYFSKLFKKRFDINPSEYIKKQKAITSGIDPKNEM